MSFRTKTILGIALIEGLFLSLLIVNNLMILSRSHEDQMTQRAQTLAQMFANATTDSVLSLDLATLQDLIDDLVTNPEVMVVQVYNSQGLLASAQKAIYDPADEDQQAHLREVSSVISVGRQNYGRIELGIDAEVVHQVIAKARTQSIQIAVLEIVLVALASLLLGNYLTRQLKQLKSEIDAVKTGNYEPNDQLTHSKDELGETVLAFQGLKQQLKTSQEKNEKILKKVSSLASEISEKEYWLRAIINRLVDGVIAFDTHGLIRYANQPARQFLGYQKGELEQSNLFEINFDPAQLERIRQFMDAGKKDDQQESMTRYSDEVIYHRDGSPIALSIALSYSRIQDDDYFILILGDTSWRRHVEEQVILSDSIKTGILESSLSAVIAIDDSNTILEFNPSAERMFGYSRQEVIGQFMPDLIMPERYRMGHELGMRHYLETGEGPVIRQRIEISAVNSSGQEFPIELAITPIHTGGKNIYTAVIDDITDRLNATQSLETAKETADLANKEKSKFVASMSHEIRTPLNIILGMVDLIQGTPLTPQQQQFVISAENAGRNLLDLINDVLDLSKIEAGKIDPALDYFDPISAFEDTVQMFRQRCWSKQLRLFLVVSHTVPPRIYSDPTFIRQIMTNLLSNAVNYTKEGSVTARLITEKKQGVWHLKVEIMDTGPGISEQHLSTIFQEFIQVHDKADGVTGTGLGLVICRELAHAIGGDVSVVSEVGRGSCFSFELPLITETRPPVVPHFEGKTIGLVSLDNACLESFTLPLDELGATIQVFNDAKAVSHAVSNASLPIDVWLYDMESFNALGSSEGHDGWLFEPHPAPVIAFIDSDMWNINTLERFYAVFQLPIASEQLVDALTRALEGTPWQSRDALLSDAQRLERPVDDSVAQHEGKILLVDDSDANRVIAQSYLTQAGYEVIQAVDGQEAIDQLKTDTFDCVLMDMRMPVLGGVEATKIIRRDDIAPNTPIIALTAHALMEVKEECLAVGMQDYLVKPIDKALMMRTVAKWIGRQPEINERPIIELTDPPESFVNVDSDSPLIEPEAVKALERDTSRAAVVRMLTVFETEVHKRLAALPEQIQTDAYDQIETAVHALKSSAQTFGALRLHELTKQAEQHCQDQQYDQAIEICRQLDPVAKASLDALEALFEFRSA